MGKRTLTTEQEREIYQRSIAPDPATHAALAAEYGVNESTISRAVSRQRMAAEEGAEGAVPEDAAAAGLMDIPWDRIHPSPINPRKHFDPERLDELAENIDQMDGVKQNVLVRPRADMDGHFWLIAGERRWRAVGRLVEWGRKPESFAMPARVEWDCDDRRHLELAMIENLQRNDMNAMEEAEGYARLTEQGMTAVDIARRILGKPDKIRYVQLRLNLVDGLCAEAQDALRAGKISVEQARALRTAPASKQAAHLPAVITGAWGYETTDKIRRTLKGGMVAVKHFPHLRAGYQGEIVTDEDSGEEMFADAAELQRLRAAELEEKKAELARQFPWVEVKGGSEHGYFTESDYQRDPGNALGGAVIQIDSFGKLQIHRHMVRRRDLQKIEAGAHVTVKAGVAKVAADPITKGHFAHAKRRKSAALRGAVARDPLAAKRLVCLALLGGHTAVDIRVGDRRHYVADAGNELAVTETIQDYGRGWGIGSGTGFSIDNVGRVHAGIHTTAANTEALLWRKLAELPEDDLDRLFAALVALRVGSFNGGGDPQMGDDEVTVEIARTLGIAAAEEALGLGLEREDLDGLRKPALLAAVHLSCTGTLITHGRPNLLAAMTAKDLAAELAGMANMLSDSFVLPTLRFASAAAIKTVMAKAVEPAQVDIEAAIAQEKLARVIRQRRAEKRLPEDA
ncbi:MAG: ParB/RepB/Spo0J family partition protein [Magnetospirillum sp.]|nr:ParB/RepB/Spo0J family partition protein [Magnetospirillum sp.]